MDPQVNQPANPVVPPLSTQNFDQGQNTDSGFRKYLKPKFIIIFLAALIIILVPIIIFASLSEENSERDTSKNPQPTATVLPPAQNSTNSWSMEIKFDPADSSYSVEKITLLNEEFVPNENNANSPYTLKILNGKKEVISSMKVSIATKFILPDIIKNSSVSAEFENAPLTSTVQIPNVPEGQTIIIENNSGDEIINVSFPSDIQAMVNSRSLNQIAASDNSIDIFQSSENVSPSGWKLKVTPVCEDGKAYAKYDYEIPSFAGVIFTYDWSAPHESLDTLRDSSWQKPVGSVIVITGSGTYVAKGNLANWNSSMGQLRYNGPVGLKKDTPFLGHLTLSGDWTCNGDMSRGGCVDGPPPSTKDIEDSTVSVDFNTSGLQCDVSTGTTPTPDGNDSVQCVPDLECSSGKKVLQICPLICS